MFQLPFRRGAATPTFANEIEEEVMRGKLLENGNHNNVDEEIGKVVKREGMINSSNPSKRINGEMKDLSTTSHTGLTNNNSNSSLSSSKKASPSIVSKTGLMVLILLAVQNCSKNLLMRYVMKDRPKFLTSAAVLGSEFIKLSLSTLYILFVMKKPFSSILTYLHQDRRNTLLLAVPASAYNLQMSLEYVALANLDAAVFSVLVQTKLLFTATFAAVVLRTRLKYIQVISLVLLTSGVMLCNLSNVKGGDSSSSTLWDAHTIKGITATLGIAVSSGFASVYTEKVIKATQRTAAMAGAAPQQQQSSGSNASVSSMPTGVVVDPSQYGLAYTQVQLALMSLITIGVYACITDFKQIVEVSGCGNHGTRGTHGHALFHDYLFSLPLDTYFFFFVPPSLGATQYGLFYNFTMSAFASVLSSALGGLIVAAVLKYADSVLKGYATAVSVILTGVLSMLLFGSTLTLIYYMGIINVVTAVLLYNGRDMDQLVCS